MQDAWTRSVLLVFSNDTASQPNEGMNVMLRVLNVQGASPCYTLYLLDDTLTNPAQVWLNAGSPVFPEQQLRAQLRAVEVKTLLVFKAERCCSVGCGKGKGIIANSREASVSDDVGL
jgi:hypothetical protein